MATALTLESIVALFPHQSIPCQIGQPTYETIHTVHDKLKANAASIPSTLGGGTHGLLGLMLGPATYNAITGHNFVIPANPGAQPIVPPGTNRANTDRIIHTHAVDLKTYQECLHTDNALKQLVLDTYNDLYLRGLCNRHTAYANVTALQLIQHLYNSYGVINQVNLNANETRMKAPYGPSQPIIHLFDQIEQAMEYADATGAPYSDDQVVRIAYLLVFKTGEYKDACKEWNRCAPADKTWNNFKANFTAAHLDLIHFQTANAGIGVASANMANAVEVADAYHLETTEALHALANATSADRTAVANLTQANATLSTQVNKLRKMFTSLDTKLNCILAATPSPNTTDHPNHAARCAANKSYCWTHGRTHMDNHTSANCRNPAEGHIRDATLDYRQGGSNKNCN